MLEKFLNNYYVFWGVLAVPGVPMIVGLSAGQANAESLIHPTGEFAARFMILAMAITPLRTAFPGARWLTWLARRRRALGVAAFTYALAHTILYLVDMETLKNILAEFWALGIWTGWAAFAIFIPLAATSNEISVRVLRRRWKSLHRLVYAAAVLTLVHWLFVHNNLGPALVHFVPLAMLEAYRITRHQHFTKRTA